jgi:hypothetical protein
VNDLSGLIFVALAIAWAAYLIPKALRHHEDSVRGRSIERFSTSMRVLARREPVSARAARLVVNQPRPSTAQTRLPTLEEQYAVRRVATHRATRRRRRVLAVLVVAIAGVVAACAIGWLPWAYVAAPLGLLLAWLVACRLMVRRERGWEPMAEGGRIAAEEEPADDSSPEVASVDATEPTGSTATRDPDLWDPVPVTLPTYVSKPPARRTVRTIDLDATGVWTSGRTQADSALAREADAAEAADRVRRRAARKGQDDDRAVGS